jgi:hypothetical protein
MRIRVIALLIACLCLSSCDLDPFGLTRKQIGSGYVLYVGDSEHDFAVLPPGVEFGSTVTQIGWRKPYIITHSNEGDQRWEVFDTSNRTSRLLTGAELRADPKLRDIPVVSAEDAWRQLHHHRGQW